MLPRVCVVVLLALGASACKGGGDAGPTGKPSVVVANAPAATFATTSAHVETAAPGVTGSGRVTFAAATNTIKLAGLKQAAPPFGVTDPVAMVDLLRGVVHVRSYGGAEVQGEGTKRYEVDIDLFNAIVATPEGPRRVELHKLDGMLGADKKLWADVFIDKAGRLRRILIPVHTDMDRPYGQSQIIPPMVSVDYSDFGGAS